MHAALPVLLLALLTADLAGAQPPAPDLVVSTGQRGGSYHAIGGRLRTTLRLQQQLGVQVLESTGSLENLIRLEDPESPVGVALVQTDALSLFLEDHRDFASAFFVLGDVGEECALLAVPSASPANGLADLAKPGSGSVVVGPAGSGAALTLAQMSRGSPSLGSLRAANEDVLEGLLQLTSAGGFTNVAAVMIVQRPSRISPPVQALMDHREKLRLLPVRAGDVANPALPDGSPVYRFDRVTLGGERHHLGMKVETLCTRGLMLGSRTKLDDALRRQLAQAMTESRSHIVGLEK